MLSVPLFFKVKVADSNSSNNTNPAVAALTGARAAEEWDAVKAVSAPRGGRKKPLTPPFLLPTSHAARRPSIPSDERQEGPVQPCAGKLVEHILVFMVVPWILFAAPSIAGLAIEPRTALRAPLSHALDAVLRT